MNEKDLPRETQVSNEMLEIIAEYSTYSTLAGLVYVFKEELNRAEKFIWVVIIFVMLALSLYWAWFLYAGEFNSTVSARERGLHRP
jgi:hypothetical protein